MDLPLQFIPRRRIVEALEQGFRLVPGHEYDPLDWAILMQSEPAREVTAEDIARVHELMLAGAPKPKPNPQRKYPRPSYANRWAWAEKKMREAI